MFFGGSLEVNQLDEMMACYLSKLTPNTTQKGKSIYI